MPRNYSGKKSAIRLYGFDEFIEALERTEKVNIDRAAKQCFEQCADIVESAIDNRMDRAEIPSSLRQGISKFRFIDGNKYMFSYGWKRSNEEIFEKVCYLNYGTPRRSTKSGKNRGRVVARSFISNAKREAAQRMRKVQKEALAKALEEIER